MSGNPEDPDKADMRIVQASAQEVSYSSVALHSEHYTDIVTCI